MIKAQSSITVYHVLDIDSVTWYYRLQSSTSNPPEKPTSANPVGWVTSEPTYTEGSTNSLYVVEKTTFSDGTYSYSDVSLSSSYEAAKTAYNKAAQAAADALNAAVQANTAYATANGKNAVYYSPAQPSGGTYRNGDLWFDTDDDNKLYTYSESTSSWEARLFGNNALYNNIDAGKITAGTIDASVINVTNLNASNLSTGTIDARQIGVTNLNANNITAGTISGNLIANNTITNAMLAGNITANKLSVTDLQAIAAKIGAINITTTSLYSGSHNTYNSSNQGFYLDKDGYFGIGNASQYLRWNTSALELAGKITATKGTIGGLTIENNGLFAYSPSSGKGVAILSDGQFKIWQKTGDYNPSSWDSGGSIILPEGTATGEVYFHVDSSGTVNCKYLNVSSWIDTAFIGTAGITATSYLTVNSGATATINGTFVTKGEFEVYGGTPHIDFHFNNSTADNTSRIIESSSGVLNINGWYMSSSSLWSGTSNRILQLYKPTDNDGNWVIATKIGNATRGAVTSSVVTAAGTRQVVAYDSSGKVTTTGTLTSHTLQFNSSVTWSGYEMATYNAALVNYNGLYIKNAGSSDNVYYVDRWGAKLPATTAASLTAASLTVSGTTLLRNTITMQADNINVFQVSGNGTVYNPNIQSGSGSTMVCVGSSFRYATTSSSKRFKQHVGEMPKEEVEKLYGLPAVHFRWHDDILYDDDEQKGKVVSGVYAEDVAALFEDAAVHDPDGQVRDYMDRALLVRLIKLAQVQHEEIEALKEEVRRYVDSD